MEYLEWQRSDEWLEDAPADLIDEIIVRLEKRALADRKRNKG